MIIPFVSTGSYPTRVGNSAKLLVDGEPAFKRICEAIEHAQQSVWATITFMWPEFQMPDGRGSALEVLDSAAKRGLDVRLIFWRPDEQTASLKRNAFWGTKEHFVILQELHKGINIRWDCAHPGFCQHQKSWVIDAGEKTQVAFVGGINLNPHSVVAPGHKGKGQNHDVYVEIAGPAVADVHHNFVQRWNEASERNQAGGYWGEKGNTDLDFPTLLPEVAGEATIQIQRTIHPGRYKHGRPPTNGKVFDIDMGEQTIFEQYCSAIQSAKQTIYIENQYVEVLEIVEVLHDALKRGVEVVLLMPATPDISPTAYESPERNAFFEARSALGDYKNFMLAGIAGLGSDGYRKPVYVHSKVMLIDDTWATVGSANLHRFSLFGNSELNATIVSHETVRAFRTDLFTEHLGIDTSELNHLEAVYQFKEISRANRERLSKGSHNWQGLAFNLNILNYLDC